MTIEAVEEHTLSGMLPPAEKVELVSSKRRPGDVCTWAQAATIMQAASATHLVPVMMVITLRQLLVFVNVGWPTSGGKTAEELAAALAMDLGLVPQA